MKRIFLLLLIPAFLLSCEAIKDATMVEFDTNLSVDIPVAVVDAQANALKSAASHDFSQTGTASLLDNPEIQDYVNYIETIAINDVELVFTGLQPGEEIETVTVSVAGVGVLVTLTDVSNMNNVHNPTIDNAKLTQASNALKNSKQITVTVAGSTNEAPMNFTVNMDFEMYIEANPL